MSALGRHRLAVRPRAVGWHSGAGLLAVVLASGCLAEPVAESGVPVVEVTIAELQEAMSAGRTTAEELTATYLARIEAYDRRGPILNSIVRLNPDALEEARALDRERDQQGPRGLLHGIPILLKDNYDLAGMPTTAGALGLAGLMPPDDGFQVRKLREAGAVVLGKTNMHELASGITTISSLGGQTLNPYRLDRNPGGSSGGTGAAIAANFAAVGWGSDTCGSIRIPSSHNNLFGLRPTKGLSSIDGILPLSHTQDVGGPLARTVDDLAIALDATVGADPADPATGALDGRDPPSFRDGLDENALQGARLGVLEVYFGDAAEDREAGGVVRAALESMGEAGAEIVEVEIPRLDSLISGTGVIDHEFKWDLADYLAGVVDAPAQALEDLIDAGVLHERLVGGMQRRNRAEERDSEAYQAALAKREPLRDAVHATLAEADLDALVYPTMRRPPALIGQPQRGSNCQLSAATGLPALSIPAGFTEGGLPIGMEMLGRRFDDARLVSLAYAFEQRVQPRRTPPSAPPLVDGRAPSPLSFTVLATGAELDPPAASGVEAQVRFTYHGVTGELAFDVSVTGVEADDLHAVVLRWVDEDGSASVLQRLAGPGSTEVSGTRMMVGTLRERFEAGELILDIFTGDHPSGAARAAVVLPR